MTRKGRIRADKKNTSITLSVTRAKVILSGVEGLRGKIIVE